MEVSKNFISILLTLLILMGCEPSLPDTIDELASWVIQSESLTQEQTIEGVKVQASYRPTDLVVSEFLKPGDDAKTIDSLREKYDQYHYFLISLSKNGKELLYQTDQSKFSERVQTLAFNMKEKVKLIDTNGKEVLAENYLFSRTYGMGSANTLLFVFAREKLGQGGSIRLTIKEFGFGLGVINFTFQVADLESAPNISFEPI